MRKSEGERGTAIRYISSVLIGSVAALMICMAFLFLCALAVSMGRLSEGSTRLYIVVGCVIGCLLGGLLAALRCRSRTLIVGLCTGVVFLLFLLGVGLLFYPNTSITNYGIVTVCAGPFSAGVAGILAGKRGGKRRR